MKKFEQSGSVEDKARSGAPRAVRTSAIIDAVSESVDEDPNTSARRRALELGLSTRSLGRILKQDLVMRPYKQQLTQELKPGDHQSRLAFAEWFLEMNAADTDFHRKIIFSDEAHFHLSGYVNTQNCRIWATENPRVIQEVPLHSTRATVWCGFWSGGVIGPFFFEQEDNEVAVSVDGPRYREMLTSFLWPKLDEHDVDDLWFQQDGASCHAANDTMALLRSKFGSRVISRRADKEWPPRSCDLSPLDYFLWGYVKDKVYAMKPKSIQELKARIITVIGEIQPDLCEKVLENYIKRIETCRDSNGGHLANIIFHS